MFKQQSYIGLFWTFLFLFMFVMGVYCIIVFKPKKQFNNTHLTEQNNASSNSCKL